MKRLSTGRIVTCALALAMGWSSAVFADVAVPAPKASTSKGIASTVDQQQKMVSLHHWWGTRRFNIADDCQVSLQDKPQASLADLRPGQKLEIQYEKNQGVLVAHRIQQKDLLFTGHVMSIDPTRHTLTLRHRALDKTFGIPDGCRVVLRDDKQGTLADVQPGHRITVTFEVPAGHPTARRIAQTSETFTGTLTAVDLDNRTVRAKTLLGEKTFNLAGNCSIVLGQKPGAKLRDLKLGDKFIFNYDDVSGVNVVNCIATASGAPEPTAVSAHSANSASTLAPPD